jgi:uncharacterized MnhB-related membrane protein
MIDGFLFIQIIIGFALVVTAVTAVRLKNLLAAAIALGGFSLILSLEFYVLQAPDVAMAEAAVGAGLTTALFVLAIKRTSDEEVEE